MYFAVKKTLSIGGKRHMPCVCYDLTTALIPTVKGLVAKGWAYTSDTYMVFEGGKRIDNASKIKKAKLPNKEPVKENIKAGF